MAKAIVQEIRMGAIYRLGAKKRFGRDTLVALLRDRAGFSERVSDLLAGHWVTTDFYRHSRECR